MSRTEDGKPGLKNKAREQIASVAIDGSSIETQPGRDPEEFDESE